MRVHAIFLPLASLALVGCTIRHECIPYVTPQTTSELGIASIALCGAGHCVSIGPAYGAPKLSFHLPIEPGTTTLEELDAKRCAAPSGDPYGGGEAYGDPYADPCGPVTGTITVREVHPPEDGLPVGRLDADLVLTGTTPGTARIDYRETFTDVCRDVDWPDIRIPWPGPGQL